MELQAIITANYLDILFDNRNKAYGGYQLRKNYTKRTLTAFSLVLSAILISATCFSLFNHRAIQIQHSTTLLGNCTLTVIQPPPLIIPPQAVTPPPAGPKTQTLKHTPPVIVPDNKTTPEDLPVENSKIENAVPAAINSDGPAATSGTSSTHINGANTNTNTTPPANTTPFAVVQVMPEFNGEIGNYLQRQLNYPAAARENGIEGQVIVQFIVNEDGQISGAKVLRGIGGGCNEEALRVVNKMPKWKPGKQNGIAVKVYFTLPIRFQLG